MKPGFHTLLERLNAELALYEHTRDKNSFKTVEFKGKLQGRIDGLKAAIMIAEMTGKD